MQAYLQQRIKQMSMNQFQCDSFREKLIRLHQLHPPEVIPLLPRAKESEDLTCNASPPISLYIYTYLDTHISEHLPQQLQGLCRTIRQGLRPTSPPCPANARTRPADHQIKEQNQRNLYMEKKVDRFRLGSNKLLQAKEPDNFVSFYSGGPPKKKLRFFVRYKRFSLTHSASHSL